MGQVGDGMSDYAVKISIRNGRILRRMEALGIESQAELCRRAGLRATTLSSIVTLQRAPKTKAGGWAHGVEDIAAVLRCDPEDLFTEAQNTMALETNTVEQFVDEATAIALASGDFEERAWARIEAQKLLAGVTNPRTKAIITARMEGATYDEIADEIGVTCERIRQIEWRAYRQMRIAAAGGWNELRLAERNERAPVMGN